MTSAVFWLAVLDALSPDSVQNRPFAGSGMDPLGEATFVFGLQLNTLLVLRGDGTYKQEPGRWSEGSGWNPKNSAR